MSKEIPAGIKQVRYSYFYDIVAKSLALATLALAYWWMHEMFKDREAVRER